MRLNVKAAAVTGSLLWGASVFLLTWWVIAFEGATGQVTWLGHLYRGYNISPAGSVIGLLWGLMDGLFCGAIVAFVYNFFDARLKG